MTTLVWSSRRSVHGMKASFPQRGHRSGFAPGGSCDGSQGIFAVIAADDITAVRAWIATRRRPLMTLVEFGDAAARTPWPRARQHASPVAVTRSGLSHERAGARAFTIRE
jgi:hypothetical protein